MVPSHTTLPNKPDVTVLVCVLVKLEVALADTVELCELVTVDD